MKKVFLAAAILFAATTFARPGSLSATVITGIETAKGGGQHIPPSQVPAAVKATFASMFPTATNVRWEVQVEHGQTVYQADFIMDGQRWRARFNADGSFISAKPR